MQTFFGVEFDTSSMTLEELEEALKNARELYLKLSYQVRLRKIANHKHSSSNSTEIQ
jgi:ribosomal protein L29